MAPAKLLTPTKAAHPLDPLSKNEIEATSATVRPWLSKQGIKAHKFASMMLKEPPKYDVIAAGYFAKGETCPDGLLPSPPKALERNVEAHVVDAVTGDAYEIIVNVDGDEGIIKTAKKLPEGTQPALTLEELCMAEEVMRGDPRVVAAAREVGVEPENLFADGWSIGWDDRFPGRRIQQCIAYARYGKDDNLYARPLDFMPILDVNTGEMLAIDFQTHRTGKDGALNSGTTKPPKAGSFESSRERIKPPTKAHNYLPELATASPFSDSPIEMRKDLKPLSVVQPEGVSFKMDGNLLEWQKWKMHVAFHPREGIVLSTISYLDDEAGPGFSKANPLERPLFYRLSLAEMVVPYGDPAWPHGRKAAFDVGEYGLGLLANSLSLGCDCLGAIKYLDGQFVKHDGTTEVVPSVICIHEEDEGLSWKHSDYRKGGRAHNVRGRKLVISMVCTVANYEYQINFSFHLDGSIHLEIKLTGILNLYMLAEGESTGGYGTEVAPRINAHYHQHLFSLRVDPHIDGPLNSISEQHIEIPTHLADTDENYPGNAFTAPSRILQTTGEAVRDADPASERTWTFVNESRKHYSSGKPVGYKIVCKDAPRLWSQPNSMVSIRAPFARHHIWTVPYDDNQRYPAGMYVPQSRETPKDSVPEWVGDGKVPIANRDIVSYVTLGTTHIPRPEDFPVMPSEVVRLHLKPIGFFARSPMLDVPSTNDSKSVPALANGNGAAATASCCRS